MIRRRGVLLGVSLLLTLFLSGGTLLGFAPLHRVLMDEVDGSGRQRFEETELQTVFVAGFVGLSVGSVAFGLLLDRVGPRGTTVLGLLLVTAGCAVVSLTNAIVPGFVLITVGGNGPYITNMTLGNLVGPEGSPLYVGVNIAFFNLAGFVYILMPALHATRARFFAAYAVLAGCGCLAALFLYPSCPPQPGDAYRAPGWPSFAGLGACLRGGPSRPKSPPGSGFSSRSDRASSLLAEDSLASPSSSQSQSPTPTPFFAKKAHVTVSSRSMPAMEKEGAFRQELRRPWLWLITLWYSVLLFVVAFLGGALPDIANQRAESEGKVDSGVINSVLNPLLGNGIPVVLAPLVGLITPRVGFVTLFLTAQAACVTTLAITYATPSAAQIPALVSYGVTKALTIGPTFEFIARSFPLRSYGSFVAFVTGAAAVLGALSIPLVDIVDRRYAAVFGAFMACMVPVSVLPYWIWTRGVPAPPPEEPQIDEEFRIVSRRGGEDSDDDDDLGNEDLF